MDTKQESEPDEPKPPVAPAPQESKPINPAPAEPATAKQLEDVEEKMSGFERSTLRWAKAAVILSALAAVFVSAQWWEMHEGGKDTHDLAIAAGNQATWTQRLADSAKIQSDKTQTLADRTKDLADRMKDQADRTKTIADQAIIQAKAAKSAADTAKETLHVSERAYVTIEEPAIDLPSKSLKLPLVNSGHIPAQDLVATIHNAFYESESETTLISVGNPVEISWQNSRYPSVGLGNHATIALPFPRLDKDKYNSGRQLVIVAGQLSYGDGFRDSPRQTWEFCFRTYYQMTMKLVFFSPCNPSEYLPQLIRLDGYPKNERHD